VTESYSCPECKGSGVYHGLNTVEPCRACGGKNLTQAVSLSQDQLLGIAGKNPPPAWWYYGETISDVCQQFSGQPMRHELSEQVICLMLDNQSSISIHPDYTTFGGVLINPLEYTMLAKAIQGGDLVTIKASIYGTEAEQVVRITSLQWSQDGQRADVTTEREL